MLGIKKIKAFTIAELMVVLVLTSIVITIAIVVLNLVQKQVSGIQVNLKKQNEIQVLDKLLWHDFNTHKLHFFAKKEVLLCTNPLDTITYVFDHEFIVRNKDTIKVNLIEIIFFLDAEKVKGNTIDAVEIHLAEDSQNKTLFIFKRKDATNYINND